MYNDNNDINTIIYTYIYIYMNMALAQNASVLHEAVLFVLLNQREVL